MLLSDMALRAIIKINLAQKPVEESIYVGTTTITKDGQEYTFDFDTYTIDIIDDQVIITCKEGDAEDCNLPACATMADLRGADVTELFLQGDEESFVEGQMITDIELMLCDAMDPANRIMFRKDAFRKADLGEYYRIMW